MDKISAAARKYPTAQATSFPILILPAEDKIRNQGATASEFMLRLALLAHQKGPWKAALNGADF
jgi:hypothetical protein